jgi:hypothetical protein
LLVWGIEEGVARERAGEFGSVGISATGEEEEDPSRGEEKGEKASKSELCIVVVVRV